jgi:predicted GH43/DUF377 family glycosyl hydrolase
MNTSSSDPFKWNKKGLIYAPDGSRPWARSHAMCPTPVLLSDEVIRIYYAGVTEEMVGRIGYVDLKAKDPCKILNDFDEPILDIGARGHFDDNGVVPISIVKREEELFLYYIGFQLGTKIRYLIFSGLAISDIKSEQFIRYSEVPVLDRSQEGTLLRSAPCVLLDETGGYHLWYIAGSEHIDVDGKEVPTYQVRYTHSDDGKKWPSEGRLVLDFANDDEYGFGRPHIVKGSRGYHMWYSLRRKSIPYRLGYAFSEDGVNWTRDDDKIGLTVSPDGWDSEMVYANSVCVTKYGTYMFYNGNDYGRTGFGYAELDGEL